MVYTAHVVHVNVVNISSVTLPAVNIPNITIPVVAMHDVTIPVVTIHTLYLICCTLCLLYCSTFYVMSAKAVLYSVPQLHYNGPL